MPRPPKKTQGEPVLSIIRLFDLLELHPSIWWKGRPISCAFVRSLPWHVVVSSYKKGLFSEVEG